ncbi:MAG: hypothetical protein PHF12_00325 [Candidatus Omnitrophica bacterium]|nr:hypothetical protein [Candidatus Omnitrophota bacterium]
MDPSLFTDNMIKAVPYIAGWIVAVILAVIMVSRGGRKPEKLFLTGACLMLAERLASPLLVSFWAPLIREQGIRSMASSAWIFSLPLGLLTLAGFVCLVWAFWLRFWKARPKLIQSAREEMF